MAGFVQQRAHVLIEADCIHEDQRHLPEGEGLAVAAGGLALAVVQIEQTQVLHLLESRRQSVVQLAENALRAADHLSHVRERLQRTTIQRIDVHVPRTQRRKLQLLATRLLNLPHHRHDLRLHCRVEREAIVRRIIETSA